MNSHFILLLFRVTDRSLQVSSTHMIWLVVEALPKLVEGSLFVKNPEILERLMALVVSSQITTHSDFILGTWGGSRAELRYLDTSDRDAIDIQSSSAYNHCLRVLYHTAYLLVSSLEVHTWDREGRLPSLRETTTKLCEQVLRVWDKRIWCEGEPVELSTRWFLSSTHGYEKVESEDKFRSSLGLSDGSRYFRRIVNPDTFCDFVQNERLMALPTRFIALISAPEFWNSTYFRNWVPLSIVGMLDRLYRHFAQQKLETSNSDFPASSDDQSRTLRDLIEWVVDAGKSGRIPRQDCWRKLSQWKTHIYDNLEDVEEMVFDCADQLFDLRDAIWILEGRSSPKRLLKKPIGGKNMALVPPYSLLTSILASDYWKSVELEVLNHPSPPPEILPETGAKGKRKDEKVTELGVIPWL